MAVRDIAEYLQNMQRDAFSPTERVRRSGKKFGKRKSKQRSVERGVVK